MDPGGTRALFAAALLQCEPGLLGSSDKGDAGWCGLAASSPGSRTRLRAGYLERDWIATAGSYLYEPPGDVHTLVVDEGDTMLTLFHNSGALLFCDEDGNTIGTTDVFDRIAAAREHYEEVGRGSDYVKRFIR